YAICNEVFQGVTFPAAAKLVRSAGYLGLEIAPFTLAENPSLISAGERREYRAILDSEGLAFVGLHWLMVAPKGLHVTTPDAALRSGRCSIRTMRWTRRRRTRRWSKSISTWSATCTLTKWTASIPGLAVTISSPC